MNRSLIAYELTGDKDAAGASLARALAAALDRAELNGDAFAAAQCAKPYRDVLLDLGVLVSSSSAVGALPADPFGFEGPTVPDDEDGAP